MIFYGVIWILYFIGLILSAYFIYVGIKTRYDRFEYWKIQWDSTRLALKT